jgi:beta-glucosidase
MPQATYQFPSGFLWGTATSSHQVEGNNTNNNWAAWENQEGRIYKNQKAGLACDWWGGRWKEDFDRARETGQNAHRMSVEWSRIQPAPDRWDEYALDYYREIVRGLVNRNMTPLITLHHFSEPLWLYEKGGWENPETPELFNRFAARVVEALKEYATLWIPINEPNIFAQLAYGEGDFPPGKKDLGAAYTVLLNLLKGHVLAYKTIHDIQPQARVGTAHHYRPFYPRRAWSPADRFLANTAFQSMNDSFMGALKDGRYRYAFKGERVPEAVGVQDFVGLNYYCGDVVAFKPLQPENTFMERSLPSSAELSEGGYIANMPEGFMQAFKWARQFDLPILVTENGVEDSGDGMRPQYLVEHIHQMWRATNFVQPIKGYFHWSLVDNFEWERGWSQRFGLWGLDVNTQVRIRRKSVDLYAAICKDNAISYETVEQYAPESIPALYPE